MTGENYIANAKLLPNFIVICSRQDLSIGENKLIDISKRELGDKWVKLSKLWTQKNANVVALTYVDGMDRVDSYTYALKDVSEYSEFSRICTRRFKFGLYSTAAVSGYICRVGVWVFKPTIADKMLMGEKLTEDEKSIAEELDLQSEIRRGLIPVTPEYLVSRSYQVIDRYTESVVTSLTAADGLRYEFLNPNPDEFLVLEGISATDTSAVTTNATLTIKIDHREALSIPLPCLSTDYDIPLFIPALDSIKLIFETDTDITTFATRWKIGKYRLTDRIKMMWDLMSKDEDEALWREVVAGI